MSCIEALVEHLEYDDWEVLNSNGSNMVLGLETESGHCTVRISEDRGDVRLDMIRALPQGRGVGTFGLQSLVGASRQANVQIVLDVRPQKGCLMDEDDLTSWYQRNGAGDAPEAGHIGMFFSSQRPDLSY